MKTFPMYFIGCEASGAEVHLRATENGTRQGGKDSGTMVGTTSLGYKVVEEVNV